jgi:hypothetical protein
MFTDGIAGNLLCQNNANITGGDAASFKQGQCSVF